MAVNLKLLRSSVRCSITSLALMFLVVASTSGVSEAGVMLAEREVGSTSVVDARCFSPDADDDADKLVDSLGQAYGMVGTSSGGVGVTFSDLVSCAGYRLTQTDLVQWLTEPQRFVIPSPIPISLLKVPIAAV